LQNSETCSGLSAIRSIYSTNEYIESSDLASTSYNNKIYLTWTQNPPNYKIHFLKSVDNGTNWEHSEFFDYEGSTFRPKIYAYQNNIHMIYSNNYYGIYASNPLPVYVNSTNNGLTWGQDNLLNWTVGNHSFTHTIDSYDGTTLHAFFQSLSFPIYLFHKKSNDAGGSWSNEKYLFNFTWDEGLFDFNSVIINGSNIYAFFEVMYPDLGYDEIYFINSSDGGDTWDEAILFSEDDGYDTFYAKSALLNNYIHVVYCNKNSSTGLNELYYSNSSNGGATWSEPMLISEEGYNYYPNLIKTYENDLYLTYEQWDAEHINSKIYYQRYSSGTWQTPVKLSDDQQIYPGYPLIEIQGNEINFFWAYYNNLSLEESNIAYRKLCI